jgi:TIR domain
MKVFISWSGQRGLAVAEALRGWLPETIQAIKPWMSRRDLNAGVRWTPEINEQLSQTKFGIICLTPENQHAPWVMFEAGALAKTLDNTYVVPYLIDMDDSEVVGPLWQFQSVSLSEEGTFDLVQSITDALGTDALPKESLERVFKRGWPELESAFNDIPEADVPVQQRRQPDEILREVLELVRDISRRANDFPSRDDLRVTGGVTTRPATLEQYAVTLAMDRARKAYEATRTAARNADEAAKADIERAREEYEALSDAVEADEHHEQS